MRVTFYTFFKSTLGTLLTKGASKLFIDSTKKMLQVFQFKFLFYPIKLSPKANSHTVTFRRGPILFPPHLSFLPHYPKMTPLVRITHIPNISLWFSSSFHLGQNWFIFFLCSHVIYCLYLLFQLLFSLLHLLS